MFIYLASRFSRIDELNRYRKQLEKDGHFITSRWLTEEKSQEGGDYGLTVPIERLREIATIDVEDVYAAETVVSFTEKPRTGPTRGGRHVEFGMGLAWGKELVIVGPVENVFHTFPEVHHFKTFKAARQWLKETDESWVAMRGLMSSTGLPQPSRSRMGTIKLSSSPGFGNGMIQLP